MENLDTTEVTYGTEVGPVGDGYDDIPAVHEQADAVEQPFDWTTLPACEYEDSDNCFWDAQASGNGYGQSFYVRDGVVTYIGDNVKEPIEIIPEHENPYGVAPCYDMVFVGHEGECGWIPGYWEDESGVPQGFVDNNQNPVQPKEAMVVPEAPEIEVPEAIESVGVTPMPPEYIEVGVDELAETGSVDVITGLLLGIALVTTGVVLFIKSKKTQTV